MNHSLTPHKLTAKALNRAFIAGDISAENIIKNTFKRIRALDPQVGAFLSLREEKALEEARKQDEQRAKGDKLGPLAGVPVALKDNIHLEGEISTCGSKFLTNYRAPFDATVTKLLRDAGAIFVGKTNMDEFAMGSSTGNSALGVTKNPWDLNCVPGGSSGGSAAAVAARLCPIALGSDTGGSIRQPASLCGIVGFKPTYGRVSRSGLVAYGSSLDQIGPLTTHVEDAALVMDIIGRPCKKDSTSLPDQMSSTSGQASAKNLTIGVPWRFLEGLVPESRSVFEHAIALLQAQGAKIVEVDLDILKYSLAVYYILATAEASTNLARFDGIRYGERAPSAKTLDEVYDLSKEEGFGKEVKRRIILGTFVLSAGYQDAYYKRAQKVRQLIMNKYAEAFKLCDIIATPTSPFTAFEIGAKQDPIQMYLEDIYTIGVNLAGLPAISVPVQLTQSGKPMGLQLIGAQKQDPLVLQTGALFESLAPFKNAIPTWVDNAL